MSFVNHLTTCIALLFALAACRFDLPHFSPPAEPVDALPIDATSGDALPRDAAAQPICVDLFAPVTVASVAPCMAVDKAIYFNGNDFIYNGTMTVAQASWGSSGSRDTMSIGLIPTQQTQGMWWDLRFSSRMLAVDLVPGVYSMAQRFSFATAGHPGLEVTGDGRGCNVITGRFEVHYFGLQPNGTTVKCALVSFEQHCEGGAPMLSGCVRYDP